MGNGAEHHKEDNTGTGYDKRCATDDTKHDRGEDHSAKDRKIDVQGSEQIFNNVAKTERKLNMISAKNSASIFSTVLLSSMVFGCANYEVNTKRGDIPGHYIRYEMQEADRAIDAAREAGKETACPVEFKAVERARDNAYDVFRACHTEEGAALAKEATAKAKALCPVRAQTVTSAEVPAVIFASDPKLEDKVVAVVKEAKIKRKVVVLALEEIHFDFDQSALKPEAKMILKRNIHLLKDNPQAKIRIVGCASASGSEDYNQKLSERRASAVKSYLINEGIIVSDRLTTIGYGEALPEAYEAVPSDLYSPAAKANMRVLFQIIVQ